MGSRSTVYLDYNHVDSAQLDLCCLRLPKSLIYYSSYQMHFQTINYYIANVINSLSQRLDVASPLEMHETFIDGISTNCLLRI